MQLLLFFVRKVSPHVDHESMMTSGLVDWCFSRRTHRRGRMITCRARAARCTRKPSPRPLPGWHFPKPASKFSLPMAVTHINVLNRYSRQSRDTHVHWQLYGLSYNIYMKKKRYYIQYRNMQYNTFDYKFLFLLSLFLCLSHIFAFHELLNTLNSSVIPKKNIPYTYIILQHVYENVFIYIVLTLIFSIFNDFFFTIYYTLIVSIILVFVSFCLDFA